MNTARVKSGTELLLDNVAERSLRRKDVAWHYYVSLEDKSVDWSKVNAAIVRRWSLSSLIYIKALAWKMYRTRGGRK